jgi:hypothetical protein
LRRALLAAGLAGAMIGACADVAWSHGCMPTRPKPPIVLRDMGACAFDPQTLSFAGGPTDQAKCLMRGMDATRNLVPTLERLPPALANRIGRYTGLPTREVLSTFLSKQDLEWDFAAYLWQPLSRAHDNDPNAPNARYFVIHDTSGPSFGHRAFPAEMDVDPKINNLAGFKCRDGWGPAHVVVNRLGAMLLSHELAIPWRATKFERASDFDGALKGLFIHIELIQPRRSASGHGQRNDAEAPTASFSAAQYDRLALLYAIASVRAGHWLIPAFHAAIDSHIRNGHDDPLNFDIDSFAASLDALMKKLQPSAAPLVASSEPAAENHAAAANLDSPTPRAAAAPMNKTPTPGGLVKTDAATQRLAGYRLEAKPEAARAIGSDAGKESKTGSERQAPKRETVSAGHCQTVVAKGHRPGRCRTDVAEKHGRGLRGRGVRSVDRGVQEQGAGAGHRRRDLHARHARTAA